MNFALPNLPEWSIHLHRCAKQDDLYEITLLYRQFIIVAPRFKGLPELLGYATLWAEKLKLDDQKMEMVINKLESEFEKMLAESQIIAPPRKVALASM